MKAPDWVNLGAMHHWAFVVLVVAITLAFGWILAPFFEAILWAVILAVLFAPLQRRLSARLGERRTLAALVTLLVLTGMRQQIMEAIPLELKKAIAIGIGLFIAFIGLYNSGLIVKSAGAGLPVELGRFTSWAVLTTIVGLVLTIALRARGFRGDLLLGIIGTTVFALIVNKATDYTAGYTAGAVWPSDIVTTPDFSLLGEFSFGAHRLAACRERARRHAGRAVCEVDAERQQWGRDGGAQRKARVSGLRDGIARPMRGPLGTGDTLQQAARNLQPCRLRLGRTDPADDQKTCHRQATQNPVQR